MKLLASSRKKAIMVFFLPVFTLLTACSFSNNKDEQVVVENHGLLQDQQATLEEHAQRLDALSESQDALLYTLSQLRTQMGVLSQQITRVAQNSSEKQKSKSNVIAKDLKLVKSANEVKVSDKATIGRLEYVWLEPMKAYVKARINTGSKTSTLSVRDLQKFERNGEPWIGFNLKLEKRVKKVELPLLRQAKRKQGSDSDTGRRPVVSLPLRLGEIREDAEIILLDRDDAVYPLLLGRSFLQDIAIVDVAQKFTRGKDPKLTKQANSE